MSRYETRSPVLGARGSAARIARVASTAWLASAGLALFSISLLLCAGCYSFTGSNLPGHIKALAVPTVRNATLEPGVEQELTDQITERFISDGRLKIASERTAEAVFIGELTNYENKVNNYTASQEPIDYIVVLTLSAQMRDQVKNRDLWKEDRLVATAVYEPGAGETEEEARREAIEILANDIVTKTLEQW
ncbi:MAG: hypothetical protein H6682_03725 [Candidatus Eisenbacteria bacterium]|nr:hypothetical protein [Candidatus Eisenbacteria bacterium]